MEFGTNVGLNSLYFRHLYAARRARLPNETNFGDFNIVDYNITDIQLTFKNKKRYPCQRRPTWDVIKATRKKVVTGNSLKESRYLKRKLEVFLLLILGSVNPAKRDIPMIQWAATEIGLATPKHLTRWSPSLVNPLTGKLNDEKASQSLESQNKRPNESHEKAFPPYS